MDLLQLQYFISAAQMLSFTQAAKQHYVSQPAISRRISDLEQELGVALFDRSSHHVALTTAGEEFLKYALSMQDMTMIATNRVKSIAAGKTGRIRICAVATSEPQVQQVLYTYARRYPDIHVELDFFTGRKQITAINENDYDFYFSFENLLKTCGNLDYMPLNRDRFYLFVPGETAYRVDPDDFTTLADLPLVTELYSEGPFLVNQILELCKERKYDASNIMGCRDVRSVAAFVNAGMGFTLLPHAMGRGIDTDRMVTFPLAGDSAGIISGVGWNPHNGNIAASTFLNVLRELFPAP